jgi:hypothetical protein
MHTALLVVVAAVLCVTQSASLDANARFCVDCSLIGTALYAGGMAKVGAMVTVPTHGVGPTGGEQGRGARWERRVGKRRVSGSS